MYAMYEITTLIESLTIDLIAEKLDDIIEVTLRKGSQKGAQKITISNQFSKASLKNVEKQITKKITGDIVEKATSKATSKLAQTAITRTNTKLLSKAATSFATKGAAKQSFKVGGMGPVTLAITVLTFGFDVLMAVWDIMDERGFQIIFDKTIIANMVTEMNKAIDEVYPGYTTSEVNFESFMMLFSMDGEDLVLNDDWYDLYTGYIHEYMTEVKGHPENWREKLEVIKLEIQKNKEQGSEEKKINILLITVIVIIIAIILLLILVNAN